jgi:hypothetical protein
MLPLSHALHGIFGPDNSGIMSEATTCRRQSVHTPDKMLLDLKTDLFEGPELSGFTCTATLSVRWNQEENARLASIGG